MSRNYLDQETSPYLLLHKDNPVHWRPWGPEALAEAEASNKPILLSIGYTACHWCHVMNEESFSDQATADIINENYIPIKVDREERPDLDLLYQTSASAMGVQAGWPLTAFLTSHGNLFFAGTYYPINEQPGLAKSFKWVLNEINRLYRDDQDSVTQAITNISQRLTDLWHKSLRGPISLETLDDVSLRIGQRYDIFYGGMTGSPKFPNFIHIQMLVRAYLRSGRWAFNQLAQSTLIQICQGGIYDHLGGGIARYSTDERWIVPHFEKMLYDNALFIETLTLAWQQDRSPLFKLRIEETIAWLSREMIVETAFASSIDADSEGEEGKYYLWSEPEIDAVLRGTFSQNFKLAYNVTREGNYKGHTVLHRLGPFANFGASSADEALFEKQRSILLEARNKRVRPIRDDKVLADWNAMMIAALANAGAVFENSQWIIMAIRAFEFLEKTVCDGERLYHSWHRGKRGSEGFAEDYAHMARAALALFETTNDQQYLDRAKSWVRHLNEFHWDNLNGGYFQTSDDAEPLSNRIRSAFDQFIPPANGIMPTVLAQLWLATNDKAYRDRCNAVVEAFSGEVNRAYISMPSFVNSIEYVATNVQVVIVGPVANPRTQDLISAVRGRPLPNKWLTIVPDGRALPTTHPAYGKTMVNGLPTAYLCLGISCSTPTSNPNELSQALNLPQKTVAPNAN